VRVVENCSKALGGPPGSFNELWYRVTAAPTEDLDMIDTSAMKESIYRVARDLRPGCAATGMPGRSAFARRAHGPLGGRSPVSARLLSQRAIRGAHADQIRGACRDVCIAQESRSGWGAIAGVGCLATR
jgi:hypothetical protein